LDSTSNSAASDKGHTGALYSKNSDPAAGVGMALFTTTLGLYGGVLWSGELQGFIIHETVPSYCGGQQSYSKKRIKKAAVVPYALLIANCMPYAIGHWTLDSGYWISKIGVKTKIKTEAVSSAQRGMAHGAWQPIAHSPSSPWHMA
jgi:hypothetical protein